MSDQLFTGVACALGGVAAALFARYAHQIWTVRIPADRHHKWMVDLEMDAIALVRARLHVAELECSMSERIGKMPPEFQSPTFAAAQVGWQIQRAVIAEAKRRGIWNPETLDAVVAVEPLPAEPPPEVRPTNDIASAITTGFRSVGGQLVPFSARR